MAYLIACLGYEKGTVGHIAEIIKQEEWEKVFIVSDKKIKGLFDGAEFIIVDQNKFLPELIVEIVEKLKGKINDTEVGINMISGTGKLHMALLSALLKLGLGIRLIALTKQGVKEV
jgi:hypothetical protein